MVMRSLVSAVVLLMVGGGAATSELVSSVYESPATPTPAGEIDRLVFAKLESLGIRPVLCSDAVFVRRAYLDIIGTMPTAQEAREFIQDPDTKNKRGALIDRLLERKEFADYWAMKWGDILRIKAEFPVNLWPNAAQAYHRWVHSSIVDNKPYDKFVREMLTSSGSNFRVGPVNFYRAMQNRTPEGTATVVALTFMGCRVSNWPPERLAGMSAFFSQIGYKKTREWKEEDVFWDPFHTSPAPIGGAQQADSTDKKEEKPTLPEASGPVQAMFPDGKKVTLSPNRDPREVFEDWLISPKNPWFTKCIVNRVWAWLLGRGIIHEPDDIRDNNPPCNPALLAYLQKEFIASHYDLKHLYRLILNSSTYQFSSTPRFKGPQAEANFASYPMRRLEAEVIIDAVNKVTGATEVYTTAIPEPYTVMPKDKPAITLADGSITSQFLTLFGRSARATGMENERINKPVPSQWLHMLNSSHIQRKLEQGPNMKLLLDPKLKQDEIVENLYLTILSRFPTEDEKKNVQEFGTWITPKTPKRAKGAKPAPAPKPYLIKTREDWIDVTWSLINSTEFLYRH